MNKVIVPPFLGEFGICIMDHLRYVQQVEGYKIVCCEKGNECLYPSADEFFTDYTNPVEDANRVNKSYYWRKPGYVEQITAVYQSIVDRYSGVEFLEPVYLDRDEAMKIKVPISAPKELPQVDIVVAPRYRQFAPEKNWEHWVYVTTQLRLMGYRVGVAGCVDTSYPLQVEAYAWRHSGGSTSGTVDLLANCRVLLSTDSGIAHLGALLDTPQIVFGYHDQQNPDQTFRMKAANREYCEVLRDVWGDPDAVIDAVVSYLDNGRHGKEPTYSQEVCSRD